MVTHDDCSRPHAAMLTVEQAKERILGVLSPLGCETVDLLGALGRPVAHAVHATRRMPPFDNSAMDGYAVRAADVTTASPTTAVVLTLIETIAAGATPTRAVGARQTSRIFTGAPIPEGADAVVMQEDTQYTNDAVSVSVLAPARMGQHIRRAGEDLAEGELLLRIGQVVAPGEIAVLAAQGRSWLRVYRRPRVAILPTGDELVEIDEPLLPGHIANSNSAMIAAQVTLAGGVPIRMPAVPDNTSALRAALAEAASAADLVLTCGGVSVGDFDLVRDVLGEQGTIDFWRVAMKPGKPLAFGKLGHQPMIGLPGNPASSYVCFELFARPAIRRLAGFGTLERASVQVRSGRNHGGDRKRREFLRVRLTRDNGELWALPLDKQGSGQQSSLLSVDALLDVPEGKMPIEKGAWLRAMPLHADF